MSSRLSIRTAKLEDLEALIRLRRESALDHSRNPALERFYATDATRPELRERLMDRCILVGRYGKQIVAMNSLDLDSASMLDTLVAPQRRGMGIGRRMVAELERLAVRFGMTRLEAVVASGSRAFFRACGYRPASGSRLVRDESTGLDTLHMYREFPRRQTRYGARIKRVLDAVGIEADYGRRHRLMLQEECRELASIGNDRFGREQMLAPPAAKAWCAMCHAAERDGIELEVASAYRSVGYQASIIERKKQSGQALHRILKVSAAPGFSEHHTGCALDLATPGSEPLEVEFERTEAFEWLVDSAQQFGFQMSFPRNNRHGIAYEPWHWRYVNE